MDQPKFKTCRKVKIKDKSSSFEGMTGMFICRECVLLKIFGSWTPVEFEDDQLEILDGFYQIVE